ncbi:MAG: aspartate aminotransferase family protein, partial [Arenimonas sp.]|nr:aspartate aminotransferase family protein [Arenimonas sp.]
NPVAMAAGLATLELIQAPGFHARLEANTHVLCDGLEAAARDVGVAVTTTRTCGMFGLYFSDRRVETFEDAMASDADAFKRFFHGMLKRGVYFAPSAFEAGFLSSAHGEAEFAHTFEAARAAFQEARP